MSEIEKLVEQADYYRYEKKDYEKAFGLYEKAAKAGHANAQYEFGFMYLNGEGVEENHDTALEWLRKAAAQGHANAQKMIDVYLSDYEETAGDEDEDDEPLYSIMATYELKELAEQGDFEAMYHLGGMYLLGGDKDSMNYADDEEYCAMTEAEQKTAGLRYVEQAAEGDAWCAFWLAEEYDPDVYAMVRHLPTDRSAAAKWYKKAADGGHKKAKKWVEAARAKQELEESVINAQKYINNDDYAGAFPYLKIVANAGDAWAQYSIGLCYFGGDGTAQDYKAAVHWFEKAAKQGKPEAQEWLGKTCWKLGYEYEKAEKNRDALEWYEKAAQAGNMHGQYNTAFHYCYKKSGIQDYKKAFYWFEKAAQQGDKDGQRMLGAMYADGKGTVKDMDKACFWWKKAAAQGDEQAQKSLDDYEGHVQYQETLKIIETQRVWTNTLDEANKARDRGDLPKAQILYNRIIYADDAPDEVKGIAAAAYGLMHIKGWPGTPASMKMVKHFLEKAVNFGYKPAADTLRELSKMM